jgi:hypothetical protein
VTLSLHSSRPRSTVALLLLAAGAVSSCSSVPGETLAPWGVRRDVASRVLEHASQAQPACRNPRIVDTEVVELHGDGKVALERWVVERCGSRVNYRVTFPSGTKATTPMVRPE